MIRREFGDPILREVTRRLELEEIATDKIQKLIIDMRQDLIDKKLGIGLAAPQVGEGIALSVIAIRPKPHRPDVEAVDLVIINPNITQTFGRRKQEWEGCLSAGSGGLFAKVPRYNKIELAYYDEHGQRQTKVFEGLLAQAIQHETDHLNGILFMDHVRDPKTYMTLKEYRKRITPTLTKKIKP